jgi:pSer/pThr/pTyr-binding forkhead associated (FHA) protein
MAALPPHNPRSKQIGPALVPIERHEGKPAVRLSRPVYVIGSRSSARIHLLSSTVSKAHALLVRSNGRTYIRDLASRSHVIINGRQVREADLEDDDVIQIGSFTFKYIAGPGEDTPRPAIDAQPAKIDVQGNDFPVPIEQRVLLIGRRSLCDINLVEASVSTAHAVIFELDGQRFIRDLGSRTGTFVNGVSTHQHQLSPGDTIHIGETDLRYLPNEVGEAIVVDEAQVGEAIPDLLDLDAEEAPAAARAPVAPAPARRASDDLLQVDAAEDLLPMEPAAPADEAPLAPEEPLAPEAPLAPEEPLEPAEPLAVEEPETIPMPAAPAAPASVRADDLTIPLPLEAQPVSEAEPQEAQAPLEPEPVEQLEPIAFEPADQAAAEPEAADEAPAALEPQITAEDQDLAPLPLDTEEPVSDRDAVSVSEVSRAPELAPADESQDVISAEALAAGDAAEEPLESLPVAADAGEPIEELSIASEPAGGHLDIADIAAVVPPADVPASEPAATEALNISDSISADEPAAQPLDFAGATDEPTTAIFDADALAAGAEAQTEIDLDSADLPDENIEETIGTGSAAMLDEPLLLPEEQSDPGAAADAEPILDFVEPIATPQELTPVETLLPPQPPAPVPLVESSAVAEPPPDEAIAAEPAPIQTPLAEAPVIPDLPPMTTPLAPLEQPAAPMSEEPQRVVAAPVKKPRARRPRRKPPVAAGTEVLENTEPTPESALQSAAEQLAIDALSSSDAPAAPADELSDTKFDRAVREFVGTEIGDIVEPATEQAAPKALPSPEPREPDRAQEVERAEAQEVEHAEIPAEADLRPIQLPEPDQDTLHAIEADFDQAKHAAENVPAPLDELEIEPAPLPAAEAPATSEPPSEPPPELEQTTETAPAPAAPKPAAMPRWGANQDNFLGGVPLNLWGPEPAAAPPPPERQAPRSPFGGATPPPPFAAPGRRRRPAAAAPNELQSLSGAPPVPPAAPSATPVGFELKGPQNDDAVKDLIEEIDSAAAAAEAATKTPPRAPASEDDEPPFMGAIPPRPRRAGAMRPRRRQDESIPATQTATPTQGTITTGFDGLAMPPVREMDVFSQLHSVPQVPASGAAQGATSIGAGDLLGAVSPMTFSEPLPASDEPPAPTRRALEAARRQAAVPVQADAQPQELDEIEADEEGEASVAGERRPQVAYAAELTESELSLIRRGYVRRVAALVVVMIALMGAAVYGINNYLGVKTTTEGQFRFANLGQLNQRDRGLFQNLQVKDLQEDETRRIAANLLSPEYPPGFLVDPVEYSRAVSNASFLDEQQQPDVMSVKIQGTDEKADRARMLAIMNAVYNRNQKWIDNANQSRAALADLKKEIEQSQRDLKNINDEIARLRTLDESRPTREQIDALTAEKDRLETAWNDSVKAVKDAQAEIERLKSVPADAAPGTAATDDDEKVKTMQAELDRLLARANESRSATSQQAVSARKNLDDALDAFQKQVTTAQDAMNGNPEIAAFIKAAQDLQETTRQLTSDLIRTQEQQFATLMELKNRLNDKMEQRRAESWQKDKELLDLNERRGYLTRQYNAAVASGLQKEADDLKTQLDLTNSQIKARQDLLPGDSFYTDAIAQIQQIVDTTRKNIEEDRARAEQRLAALQKSFISSQAIQKLPQEQKSLAQQLQNQLERINVARSQYNQAADAGAADADTTLRSEITTLQAAIEARKKQIADENLQNLKNQQAQTRLAAIEARQQDLAKLNDAEKTAEAAYFAKFSELRDARAKLDDARKNAETLDAKIRQKGDTEALLQERLRNVESKQQAANTAVEPVKPSPNDITVVRGEDRRLLFTLISCGTILVFFFVLILWNVHALSMEAPSMSIRSADLQPMSEPVNGTPKSSKNGDDNEEDHEPAVV